MREHETDLTELESALGSLTPRSGVDRDVLLFRAGRASAPQSWGWTAAAVSSLTAAVLFFLLLTRPAPAERVVYVLVPAPAPPQETPPAPPPHEDSATAPTADFTTWQPQRDSLRLRDHLLHWGLDGLPPPAGPVEPAETPGELLRSN
jgi:hypothetical protein